MEHAPQHQLDLIRAEWRSIRRSRASRLAADLLRDELTDPPPPWFTDLGDVVDLLEPGSGLDQVGRARLVADLLAACPLDPMLERALLQTLLPGIVAVARRLRWGERGSEAPAAFLGDLITLAYEVIAEWSGQRRPYAAPDILNALRCRMRRRLELEDSVDLPFERADGSSIDLPSPEVSDRLCELEAQVRALAHLDPLGATALVGREVYGFTYAELAAMTGASPRQVADAAKTLARRISR